MKIGFFAFTPLDWDEKSECLGGAETWAERTTRYLALNGYDVTIYIYPFEEHTSKEGVKYKFFEKYDKEYFDIAIVSRFGYMFNNINSKHIFFVAHEQNLYKFDPYICESEKFAGVGVLSKWQKKYIEENFPFIPKDKFFYFSNGYDKDIYETNENNIKKENSMVWSSVYERWLEFFEVYVFPKIRKKIPDFKLYLCSYMPIPEKYIIDGTEYLGNLGKKELSNLQKKCKIWVYPNLGVTDDGDMLFETFCITAVENGLSGNAIVTNNGGGFSTTLEGYPYLLNYDETKNLSKNEYGTLLAEKAIEFLNDDSKRNDASNYLKNKFKKIEWNTVSENFILEIKKIYFSRICKFLILNNPVHFDGNRSDIFDYTVRAINGKGVGRLCCINSNNGKRYHEKNNEHHYTTDFHYNIIFPQLSELLGINASLKEDFNKVEYFNDGEDYSFLYPKRDKRFKITFPKYYNIKGNNFNYIYESKTGFYNILFGDNLNYEDNPLNYHKLFSLAHYSCVIENNSDNNGKNLLISGDSHMIPLLPILCYYYKKIVYLDNRDTVTFRSFWLNKDFDDVLYEMQDYGNNRIERYILDNFK